MVVALGSPGCPARPRLRRLRGELRPADEHDRVIVASEGEAARGLLKLGHEDGVELNVM